jgi:crotonobetaine/carnitine-CoA ligase
MEQIVGGAPELRHVLHRGAPHAGPTLAGVALYGASVSALDEHRVDAGPLPEAEVVPRDLAALIYTSGTTGPSKGCACSHNYLVDQGVRLGGLGMRTAENTVWRAGPPTTCRSSHCPATWSSAPIYRRTPSAEC